MTKFKLTEEQLLGELEDILRSAPEMLVLVTSTPDALSWLGRAAAAVECWDYTKMPAFNLHISQLKTDFINESGYQGIMVTLHQARNNLRMRTIGPVNTAVGSGNVFDYFDELRKIIELATAEVFFVDPYLDVEFISRYLPHARDGVAVRLLTNQKAVEKFRPALNLFAQQSGKTIELRSTHGLHDRYLFLDQKQCFQSGASFKDGAKNSPTTLTQITDAFYAVLETYNNLWTNANVE